MDFLDKDYFLGTLVIGVLVVYLIAPTPDIVFKSTNNELMDIKETDCGL